VKKMKKKKIGGYKTRYAFVAPGKKTDAPLTFFPLSCIILSVSLSMSCRQSSKK
jgi:hypothetical protein